MCCASLVSRQRVVLSWERRLAAPASGARWGEARVATCVFLSFFFYNFSFFLHNFPWNSFANFHVRV